MPAILVVLWFLNLIDTFGTWYSVGVARYATEVNPVMLRCISGGWWLFIAAKLVLVTGCIAGLWVCWKSVPENRRVYFYLVTIMLKIIYLGVCVVHVANFIRYIHGGL